MATNFPGGVSSFGVPVLPASQNVFTGVAYFVCSLNGSNGNTGLKPSKPFATLAYAVTRVTANNDDVIYVMSGHAENLVAAASIACATAGFSIVGLGSGNRRPTFTWKTLTSASWTIAGANVLIKNIRCTSTIAGLVKLFSVTGAGVTFDTVDYYEDGTTDCLQFVLTTAAATDMTIQNCSWYRGTTAASALSQWIVLTGADRAKIINNFLINKGYATANPINSAVAIVTTFCIGIQIVGNRFYDSNSTGNIPLVILASTTGMISDNRLGTSKTASVGGVQVASCFAQENYISNEVAKSGFLDPAADTT